MGGRDLFGSLEFDTVERDGVKLTGVKNTTTNEILKVAFGLPEQTNKKISVAGSIKDLFTSFSANVSKEKGASYNWMELYQTNPTDKLPLDSVAKVERQLETHSGVLFSNKSQVLFTPKIEPDKIDVSISTVENIDKLSPAITINTSRSNWLHEWTISDYLSHLSKRFHRIEVLDLLLVESPIGEFSFLYELSNIDQIRILTNKFIGDSIPTLKNVTINSTLPDDYFFKPVFNIVKMIIIGNYEYQVQKRTQQGTNNYEDTFSSLPHEVLRTKEIFDTVWNRMDIS